MTDVVALISAIAALIGALTGLAGFVVMVRRTSPRERMAAAEGAARTILDPSALNQSAIDLATSDYLHERIEHEGQAHD